MPNRGEQTRQQLLDATVAVLRECGWGGVTTRAVAEAANVKPGLVHYHFDTVADLRRQAVVAAMLGVFEPFIELAAAMTPTEMMFLIAEASVDEVAPGTDISNLLYEVMPATTRDEELRDELRAILGRFRKVLADSIRRHHPDAVVDPDVLAEVIGATLDGLQLHLHVEPTLDLAAHMQALVPLLGPAVTPTEEAS